MTDTLDAYQAWRSGKVNRMHTMPQLIRENVAEHTWGVAFLMMRFYPEMSKDLLMAVILHDAGELAVGDMPGNVKWLLPDRARLVLEELESDHIKTLGVPTPELTHPDQLLLEIFDRVEFCMSCLHEMRMGNMNAGAYYVRSGKRALALLQSLRDSDCVVQICACEKLIAEMHGLSQKYLQHMGHEVYHAFG